MNMARPGYHNKTLPPSLNHTEHSELSRKKQLDTLFCHRDDLSLRIEMARMSGLALQLTQQKLSSTSRHPLINHIIHDLKQLYRASPREAIKLRERLFIHAQQQTQVPETFQGKLHDSPKPHLTNLAVR